MQKTPVLLAIALLAGACAHQITKEDVASMKRQVKYAKRDLSSANKSVQPLKDYVAQLKSGNLDGGYYLMVSPSDIKAQGKKAFIPYKFPAKEIHSKISGTFTTKKILAVEVLAANKLKVKLLIVGKKVKVHYKGSLYKPHIKKIKAGLEKGMKVDLLVTLSLSKSKESIVARTRCSGVNLLKNNDSKYRSNIKGAINKALSKKKYVVPIQKKGSLRPSQLFTTGNHVVVKYE
jgi:hypothetical protein